MLLHSLNKKKAEAGCDEAGRGCLSGPVFAAAVILPSKFKNSMLNDSKKLNEKKRNELRKIIEGETIWAVATASAEEIDQLNILNASILAMHRAIEALSSEPDHLLIDGNKFKPYRSIPHNCIIKGDGKYMNIAAASILAKTHRDEYMLQLHHEYPQYHWNQNKGYPTLLHRNALTKFGLSPHHRKTYMPVSKQLFLFDK